jgi:hypothetical protein
MVKKTVNDDAINIYLLFYLPVAADGGGGILLLYGVVRSNEVIRKFCIFLETFNVNKYLKLTLSNNKYKSI